MSTNSNPEILELLRKTKSFKEYLNLLTDFSNHLVVFSVKDTPGCSFNNDFFNGFKKLGLKEDLRRKHWCGYVAVLFKKRIIFEKISGENEPIIYENELIDNVSLLVESRPLKCGNLSTISINDNNHSLNKRGINIVVFDIENNYILDAVVFDTHISGVPCYRRDMNRLDDVVMKMESSFTTNNIIHTKIELLEFHNNQRMLEIKARKKIEIGKKLRVFFITPYASKFGMTSVYKKMKESAYFDPYVFIVHPRDTKLKEFPEYQKDLKDNYEFFKKKGFQVILGYDDDFNPTGLERYLPDIVFISYQNLFVASYYKNIHINYNYLTCYSPYGISVVKNFNYHFENYHVNSSWRVFSETKFAYIQALTKTSHNGINYILSGYPKLDDYMQNVNHDNSRKKIIVAPHWSIRTGAADQNMATFHLYFKQLLELVINNTDCDFFFKPHPDLYYRLMKLERTNVDIGMTTDDYKKYLEKWSSLKNGFVVEEGDYINLFSQADLMITDCGSFIAEWLPSLKPCIYLLNPEKPQSSELHMHFNELGVKILETYYLCSTWNDIEQTFNSIVKDNKDEKSENRHDVLREEFPNIGESGKFIVDYLEKIFES